MVKYMLGSNDAAKNILCALKIFHNLCVSDKADLDESGTPVSLAAVTTRTPSLVRLDLSLCHLTDEAARIFLAALSQSDPEFVPRLDRLDLSGCSFSEYALEIFEEVNKKRGADLIVFKCQDATHDRDNRRACCRVCFCC